MAISEENTPSIDFAEIVEKMGAQKPYTRIFATSRVEPSGWALDLVN